MLGGEDADGDKERDWGKAVNVEQQKLGIENHQGQF